MSEQPSNWKRTARKAGYYFLIFMAFVYLFTYRNGTPYKSGVMALFIICVVGAFLLGRSIKKEEQREEAALEDRDWMEDLKHDTLQLAMDHGGVLTVTDVATDLEVTMADAERVLTALDDGVRVTSSVTEDGVIIYEFKEIKHRQARLSGTTPPQS